MFDLLGNAHTAFSGTCTTELSVPHLRDEQLKRQVVVSKYGTVRTKLRIPVFLFYSCTVA